MMKKLVIIMIVTGLSGCATMQTPAPVGPQPQSTTYDRWTAVQQSATAEVSAAAAAGEDPTQTYFRLMTAAANSVLQDGDPQDWAWKGKGPRPSAEIFQQDRYRCLQGTKDMIAGTGADNTVTNLTSGFVGAMNAEGWEWQ